MWTSNHEDVKIYVTFADSSAGLSRLTDQKNASVDMDPGRRQTPLLRSYIGAIRVEARELMTPRLFPQRH